MFNSIKTMLNLNKRQGARTIKDLRTARPSGGFRGLPVIGNEDCPNGCFKCIDVCPTDAIKVNPFGIDMRKCVFCPDCTMKCPVGKIVLTNEIAIGASNPESLVITMDNKAPIVAANDKLKGFFGRSLKLRSISAGGCNRCELELKALSNVNFDIGRFGISFTPSPRHADGIVITGPLSTNMADALEETWKAVPEPKILILVGACALSGGLFAGSPALDRTFLDSHKVDIYIPGCPPHPLTVANALLDFLGR